MNSNGARVVVARYHQERDERLIKLFGKVLQSLHDDQCPRTPSRLMTEITVMGELIDSYENLGRFEEAALIKIARVSVVHEHQMATGGIKVTVLEEAA